MLCHIASFPPDSIVYILMVERGLCKSNRKGCKSKCAIYSTFTFTFNGGSGRDGGRYMGHLVV